MTSTTARPKTAATPKPKVEVVTITHAQVEPIKDVAHIEEPTYTFPEIKTQWLGLRENSKLVGVVGVKRLGPKRAGIRGWFVVESRRGKGYEQKLLEAAEALAVKEYGSTQAELIRVEAEVKETAPGYKRGRGADGKIRQPFKFKDGAVVLVKQLPVPAAPKA